jgi:homoserine kinase type II
LDTPLGELCLRRWPAEQTDVQRLQYIHRVLAQVARCGFTKVPLPVHGERGTLVQLAGHYWELTPWMPGQADYHVRPSRSRLASALSDLARFHLAAASAEPSPPPATPQAVQRRLDLAQSLQRGGLAQIEHQLGGCPWPELPSLGRQLVRWFHHSVPAVAEQLEQAQRIRTVHQACIRDIWHDHVLFVGDQVSGFIDFGAMQPDTPTTDVARLLGSLVQDDNGGWQAGLEAYQQVRPLSDDDLELVGVLDRANVLLSGMNWLRWIAVERRQFDDRARVIQRIQQIAQRLERLAALR